MNRRVVLTAPLAVAALGGGAFYAMLDRMKAGTFDPRGVPSMLIGKPVPEFALDAQAGDGFSSRDLASGHPIVLNFFASWCEPCVLEAPVLMELKQENIPLYGIAYKDKPPNTAAYLARNGNPYARIARDDPGRVAIDFGLTGVPETYLVDGRGIVRWRFVGPMTEKVATADLPALMKSYA